MRSYKDTLVAIACPSKQHCTPLARQINGGFQCFARSIWLDLWLLGFGGFPAAAGFQPKVHGSASEGWQCAGHSSQHDSRDGCKQGIIEAWCIAFQKAKTLKGSEKQANPTEYVQSKPEQEILKSLARENPYLLEPGAPASATCENMSPARAERSIWNKHRWIPNSKTVCGD